MRSSVNYAHLLAERLGLHLTDASWSGETAAQIADGRPGRTAQLGAVTADTKLVTLTCGGNDVGYIPRLTLASLPRPLQQLIGVRRCIAEIGDTAGVRRRAPQATVVLVDYLTLLPPDEDTAADPLPAAVASRGRQTAERLAAETAKAAARAGCHYRAASSASRDHHARSAQPWTMGFRLSPRRGAAYHPNAVGTLTADRVTGWPVPPVALVVHDVVDEDFGSQPRPSVARTDVDESPRLSVSVG